LKYLEKKCDDVTLKLLRSIVKNMRFKLKCRKLGVYYVEQGFFLCVLFLCSSSSSFVLKVNPQHSYFSFLVWQQGIFGVLLLDKFKFCAYKPWVVSLW